MVDPVRSLALIASLSITPGHVAAQALELSYDSEAMLHVDLEAFSDSALEAAYQRALHDEERRSHELPAFEVGPAILIPLGAGGALGGICTVGFSRGGSPLFEIGVGIIVPALAILFTGLAWLIELRTVTRRSPSWQPYTNAVRAVARIRVERAHRDRRLHGEPRHRRADPWH